MTCDMEKLSPELRARVEPFCKRMLDATGAPVAVYLVGPSARGEFSAANPEIQLLFVYESITPELLDSVARMGSSFGSSGIRAPFLFSREPMERARDVFPMQFLDLLKSHIPLGGEPVLEKVEIDPGHLRLQCERELRTLRINLSQAYLRSAGDLSWLAHWLREEVVNLFPVLRAMLYLMHEDAGAGNTEVARRLSERCKVDLSPFVEVWTLRKAGKTPPKDMTRMLFLRWYETLESLVRIADVME